MCGLCESPDTPDYVGAAQAQGAANLSSALASSYLSNPNISTPTQTTTWSEGATTTDKDGNVIPGRPTMTTMLSPAELQKLNLTTQAQMSSLGTLNDAMPNIRDQLLQPFGLQGSMQADPELQKAGAIQNQFDYASAPGMPTVDAGVRDQVANSIYSQGYNLLQPAFQQKQQDLDTMLANQGITRGSAAQGREQGTLDTSQMNQLNDLAQRSIQGGGDAMQQLYNMQMGSRQQGVQEATNQGQLWNTAQNQAVNQLLAGQTARNTARSQTFNEYMANRTMPINMLNSLISSSQVANPQLQGTQGVQVNAPDLLGAATAQGNASANATAANNAQTTALISAALAAFASDRRLKSNIRPTGRFTGKLPLYEYSINGHKEVGVLADEVELVMPEAVVVGSDGFKRVRYDLIGMPNGPEHA
jgi:hypothetical protein